MRNRVRQLLFTTTALVSLGLAQALGNPLGPQVAAGTVQIDGLGSGTVSVQQSTNKAIVNWNSFDIGLGETTSIVQPSIDAVLLNRVTGGLGASQILGTLKANGQVFLINPDGVLFGRNATVDVGALVATTHGLVDGDFLSGNYEFRLPGAPDASIVNLGTISVSDGGFAALVAPGVRNDGIISANLGKLGLASGNSFSLDLYGDGLIKLAMDDEIAGQVIDLETGLPLKSLVANNGLLRADGGTVQLTAAAARQVLDAVINNTGVIEADTIGTRNGKIVLSAQSTKTRPAGAAAQQIKLSGQLSAVGADRGEIGGDIEITGEEIALTVATIDAFGWSGGGTVLVGGDVGGRSVGGDAGVANAVATTIDAATSINASATVTGNGGKVVVWSDEGTRFAGTILARGGQAGGNGGFVEVSGRQRLAFSGVVDVGAVSGDAGTLLLDPQDISIGGDGAWVIDPAALEAALLDGHTVIATGANGAGQGNITVAADLTLAASSSLLLFARHNIVIEDGVIIGGIAGESPTLILASGVIASLPSAKMTGTGSGTVIFNGSGAIDFSEVSFVEIIYNPENGYAQPTDFTSHVTVPESSDLLTTMWVNDAADLQNVATNLSGRYLLSDIDMSGVANFTPIGDAASPFEGEFYGTRWGGWATPNDWATIRNLTVTSAAADVGLFGVIGASGDIEGLNIVGAVVTGTAPGANVGILAGTNHSSSTGYSQASGTVEAAEGSTVGGLVGSNFGDIHGTGAEVTVISHGADANGDGGYAGGLVGTNSGYVNGSYSRGPAVVNASTTAAIIGGLIGYNSGSVSASYARGTVQSVLGYAGPYPTVLGGLIGINTGFIAESYSSGAVQGAANTLFVGGLVGAGNPGGAPGSYWDVTTSGLSSSVGGIGLSTADLKLAFPNDPEESDWGVDPAYNGGYPYLAWERRVPGPLPVGVLDPLPGTSRPTLPNDETGSNSFGFVPLSSNGKSPLLISSIPDWGKGDTRVETWSGLSTLRPGLKALAERVLAAYGSATTISKIAENAPYARLADAAYRELPIGSTEVTGWTVIDSYPAALSDTGLSATLFKSDTTGEVVVSFRGTQSARDMIIDVSMALAPVSGPAQAFTLARFNEAAELVGNLAAKYPKLAVTGHSLGGGEAQYAAAKNKLHAIAFDPAPIAFLAAKNLDPDTLNYDDIVSFRGPSDPLTASTRLLQIGPKPINVVDAVSIGYIYDGVGVYPEAILFNHASDKIVTAMSGVELVNQVVNVESVIASMYRGAI